MGLSSGRSSGDFNIFQGLKSLGQSGFNLGPSMSDVESVNENVIEDGQLWYAAGPGPTFADLVRVTTCSV